MSGPRAVVCSEVYHGTLMSGVIQPAGRNWQDTEDSVSLRGGNVRGPIGHKGGNVSKKDGVSDYKEAMNLARRKQRRHMLAQESSSSEDSEKEEASVTDVALVTQAEFDAGQNWLEDDVTGDGILRVQRTRGHFEDFNRKLPDVRQKRRSFHEQTRYVILSSLVLGSFVGILCCITVSEEREILTLLPVMLRKVKKKKFFRRRPGMRGKRSLSPPLSSTWQMVIRPLLERRQTVRRKSECVSPSCLCREKS